MTIIPLAKVTVLGLSADRERLLDGLQSLGCLHLIPLADAGEDEGFVLDRPSEDARQALRYLMDVRRRRHQTRVDADFAFERIVAEALANRRRKQQAEDRLLALGKRLEELRPWGDFTLPALDALGGCRLWFYRVPHPKAAAFRQALQGLGVPWQRLHETARHAYVVLIAEEEPDPALLPVPRSHVGSQSYREVQRECDLARTALEDVEAEHESLSCWLFLLSKHLTRAEDAQARHQASAMARDDSTLVQLQGWIPRPLLPRLQTFAARQGLAYLADVPEPRDSPPTLLRNPASLSGGQDLVTFYETPAYRDWDPSIVVFFSFAFFFAMIMADAGYALVLGVVLALKWKSMGRSAGGRHFRILAAFGLVMALVYGMLAGSYFGIEPPQGSPLAAIKLLDLNDFPAMMQLSLLVGCAHLLLANGVVAVRGRSLAQTAPPIGWMAVIVGGLTLYLGNAAPPVLHVGLGLIAGGLLTVLLLSSERQVHHPMDLLLRLLDGAGSLTAISKLFGDVMSYLRLFALGLASASLAITFNQLAGQVSRSDIALGVPIALLILVLGHGINLLLAIISGFVHGLRLNFIEFFNWGLSGEGVPFRPFIKKELAS
ncbi:V-type ATP synthase subunit I, putative [Cyanobium sp. PCC 7001]|uniref:V-type ATP synthase subunit I n=1 Tax=Cyanobium sp. PCC 7001 TaxID=180281 RepID=UPI0001804C12|nr:V-type ATPase 116kDa subunit family protein [Cyanobium sp. PCC 7001]EDY39427.1 V-type ATP synthase subunit I, putative [Cyanobium sp. PCC 7001]